jgi:F-type H+-transporting ATPase subunit b
MDAFPIFASIGSDLANTATQVATEFGLSWPYFIAQVVSFSIVAFCLHRFAYKPILKVLEDRRRTIAESLANADRINEELAKTEAARKEILAQANDHGLKLIEEARAAAAQVQKQETQKAVAAAEQIIAKAREAAAADHARMLSELKREVASLVAQTTAKVTGKILTVEDQRRLAEETNRQIAA